MWADVARRALFNGITEIDELAIKPVHRLIPLSFPDRCGVVLRSASTLRTGCDINILPTDSPVDLIAGWQQSIALCRTAVEGSPIGRRPAAHKSLSETVEPLPHQRSKTSIHVLPDFDSGNEF